MNDQQRQDRADYLDLLQSLATIAEVKPRNPRCSLPYAMKHVAQVAPIDPLAAEEMFALLPTARARRRWANAAADITVQRLGRFTMQGCARSLYSLLRLAYTRQDVAEAKAAYSAAQAPTVGPLAQAMADMSAMGLYGIAALVGVP